MTPLEAITVILFLITNIRGHSHDEEHKPSKKIHKCIHDTLEHEIIGQYVKYNNHPYDSINTHEFDNDIDRRKLISAALESSVEPIRISPYYDPTTICTTCGLTTDTITYIKQLTSAAIRYFEQFVSVVPVDGSLFLHQCTTFNMLGGDETDEVINWVCAAESMSATPTCGDITIPDDHIAETWVRTSGSKSTKVKDAGNGIADADLIVYVSYGDTESCGDSTLAYAGACRHDQYGRPVAGYINFCTKLLDGDDYWKFDVMTVAHELTHVIVMSSVLWQNYFYDSTAGTFQTNTESILSSNTYITTDKVKEHARDHFDCDSLVGAPLENSGGDGTVGSHWEAKYINYEYMNGASYSAWAYTSKFTLALMEDSGWYKVDYSYAEPYTWGQGEGCSFIDDDCIDNGASNFPQFWCDSSNDNGCTADYVGIGICYLTTAASQVPTQFKYYSDNPHGYEAHDYCGFVNPVTDGDFEKICWDTRGNQAEFDGVSVGSSSYAVDSRCVDTLAADGSTKKGYCFKHECTGFDAGTSTYSGVDITVNTGEVISCSRADGDALVVKDVTSVSELQSITCPDIDTVCGTTTKPFECFYGEYNDVMEKCICSAGYTGTQCDMKDMDLVTEAQPGNGVAGVTEPTHKSICITGVTADNAGWLNRGYEKTSNENEGYPVYNNGSVTFGDIYVYYQRASKHWLIGGNTEGAGYYGYCDIYSDMSTYPDITECQPWYILPQVNGRDFERQSGVKVTYDSEVCDDGNSLGIGTLGIKLVFFVAFFACFL